MLYEMMSATEYGVLKGFTEKSTRVHQIIRSGVFPEEWVYPPKKIGNQWVVFVSLTWIKDGRRENL
jgi:hypothetical protein